MSASLRKRPKCCIAASPLFDHLVGEREQCRRYCETEQFCRLRIDRQLKLGRLHDGQVRWICAFEDTANVNTDLSVCVRYAGSVAHQATGQDIFAKTVHRWHGMARRKRDKLGYSADEEWVARHQERVGALVNEGRERSVDFAC